MTVFPRLQVVEALKLSPENPAVGAEVPARFKIKNLGSVVVKIDGMFG